jgi:ATP-dependent RNA helicase DOB1
MTTEILRNTLFQKQMIEKEQFTKEQISLYFEMDIQNELGCVVFDEVHYINDRDRGKVWEETILMLPNSTLMVMLSATIDGVERFAQWIEKKKRKRSVDSIHR